MSDISCLQEEEDDIFVIMTVFALISILHVFGLISNRRKQHTGKQ